MVFPAVGSVNGVGGSRWQSDLTMHNPFRDPITVSLRFVSGDGGTDRRFTLGARQTMRWADVVRTLFRAGDTLGTLWIEHREGRAPVAVVKTSDVAHNAPASLDEPLTDRDSATANTDNAELAIVGIPGQSGAGRRVNVGVVNTGKIPNTFRVSARTRNGRTVGRSLEAGVPEDQVWVINDIENTLGIRLDETMTLRLEAIAGTGVAYATVVDLSGSSQFIAAIPAQLQ